FRNIIFLNTSGVASIHRRLQQMVSGEYRWTDLARSGSYDGSFETIQKEDGSGRMGNRGNTSIPTLDQGGRRYRWYENTPVCYEVQSSMPPLSGLPRRPCITYMHLSSLAITRSCL